MCVDSGGIISYDQDLSTDSDNSRPVMGYIFDCNGSENNLTSCAQYNLTSRCYAKNTGVRCGEFNSIDWSFWV